MTYRCSVDVNRYVEFDETVFGFLTLIFVLRVSSDQYIALFFQ
jgi:hypothetical protein